MTNAQHDPIYLSTLPVEDQATRSWDQLGLSRVCSLFGSYSGPTRDAALVEPHSPRDRGATIAIIGVLLLAPDLLRGCQERVVGVSITGVGKCFENAMLLLGLLHSNIHFFGGIGNLL